MAEPFLKNKDLKGNVKAVYRMTVRPSFYNAYAMRLIVKENGSGIIHYVASVSDIKPQTRRLSQGQVNGLLAKISAVNFWSMPLELPLMIEGTFIHPKTGEKLIEVKVCADGSTFILEGQSSTQYHRTSHGCSHKVLDDIVNAFHKAATGKDSPEK